MSIPFVSVLVTSYNRERYIQGCIESILASTFKDFELLIIDDCSTDRTVDVAKQFTFTDDRVRIYVNDKNLGQFANRNRAASLARGKYLKYVDSDDLLYPHTLDVLVRAALKFPDAGAASQCSFSKLSEPYPVYFTPRECYLNHYLYSSSLLFTGPSGTLIRKDIFDKVKGFDDDKGILADTLFMLRAACYAPVIGVQSDLFFWRRHEEQVTTGQSNFGEMLLQRKRIDTIALAFPDCPLDHNEKAYITKISNKLFVRNCMMLAFGHRKFKEAFNIVQEFNLRFSELLMAFVPNRFF